MRLIPRRHWTREENATLRQAILDGESSTEIADLLGRPLRGVQYRQKRLGLPRQPGRRPDIDKRLRVLGMLAEGMSMKRISRTLGLADCTVQRMCARMVRDGLLRRTGGNTRNARYEVIE